jgi:hypothetical protein
VGAGDVHQKVTDFPHLHFPAPCADLAQRNASFEPQSAGGLVRAMFCSSSQVVTYN